MYFNYMCFILIDNYLQSYNLNRDTLVITL